MLSKPLTTFLLMLFVGAACRSAPRPSPASPPGLVETGPTLRCVLPPPPVLLEVRDDFARARAAIPWAAAVFDAENAVRLAANLKAMRHWISEVRIACEPPAVTVEPGEEALVE